MGTVYFIFLTILIQSSQSFLKSQLTPFLNHIQHLHYEISILLYLKNLMFEFEDYLSLFSAQILSRFKEC